MFFSVIFPVFIEAVFVFMLIFKVSRKNLFFVLVIIFFSRLFDFIYMLFSVFFASDFNLSMLSTLYCFRYDFI